MITDDERRELAARLRACESHIDAAGWFWLNDELGGAHVVASSEERLKRGTALLAYLIEPDDPPYNLYTLYEAVFHRSPRYWECIEDDEVDELVDALLDICNSPGHECIQRFQPSEPEVRCVAEVKVDGERIEKLAHDAVVELTGIDRDALLALADEMDAYSGHFSTGLQECTVQAWAVAIREALGVEHG